MSDPDGRDTTIVVLDQDIRPQDNGTQGTTYTADIYVFDDANGELKGPYSGSSYPNSKSNKDNSTKYNTVKEGEHEYNNESGHKGGTRKGLNLVDSNSNRNSPGEAPNGNNVTMNYVNVHSGASDRGNCNSRGSQGCVTIAPVDVNAFMNNFDWGKNSSGTKGGSTGTIDIQRGTSSENQSKLNSYKQKAWNIKKAKERKNQLRGIY